MKRILITGYAGFIGSHVTEKLLALGNIVIGVDNFNDFYEPKIKRENTARFINNKKFIGYELDLAKFELNDVFKKNRIDLVIHLAASAGVRPSMKSPVDYTKNNITAMVNLLDTMQRFNVKKIIFASSSSVYGGLTKIPFVENVSLNKVLSIYAATKLSGETFNQMYHDTYNFSIINLRFFTVYGPRQRPDLAIHKFFKMMQRNEEITIYGKGLLKRDYTYIDDTVDGVIGAIRRLSENTESIYETYNLGNNTPISVNDLVATMEIVSGLKAKKSFAETPLGDVPVTYACIEKAKENLNYQPKVNMENGLKEFWKWLNKSS